MRFALALCVLAVPVWAQPPAIEAAIAHRTDAGWTISVTLRHPDTGWDHYADGWEVLTQDGTRLGFRALLHPHVTEQPFTRSLSAVAIPPGAEAVLIRARCSVTGWGETAYRLELELD